MIKLILIDDEKLIRGFIRSIIDVGSMDIQICGEASDGIEGLKLCRRIQPDIILTDIRMPGIDGLDLLREIKKHLPHSKVILISGYDEFEYAKKAVKYGATDYVLKPVDEEELNSILNSAVIDLEMNKSKRKMERRLKTELKKLQDNLAGEHLEEESCAVDQIQNASIRKALSYIHDNSNKALTLSEVAERVYLSPEYFSRLFKSEIGSGFQIYVTELKINRGKVLLEKSNLKISEIADMLGYADPGHFIKVFRKFHGITPGKYREKLKLDKNIQ